MFVSFQYYTSTLQEESESGIETWPTRLKGSKFVKELNGPTEMLIFIVVKALAIYPLYSGQFPSFICRVGKLETSGMEGI